MRKPGTHLAVIVFALSVSPAIAKARALSLIDSAQHAPATSNTLPPPSTTGEAPPKRITAYTLPPERYQQAHQLGRTYFRYLLISFCYGLIVLWLILRLRIASRYRSWAERVSPRRFVQAIVFAPLLLLTIAILELPTGIYRHWVNSTYGLSIQRWPSWFWDWTKAELITIIGGTLFIWLLYAVIRKSPRRWWLYFWLVSLPIALVLIFLAPLYLDPQFHQFEPLATKDPALTIALQNLAHRSGQDIPPERMFWMGAGEKTTTLNAYVTGFGASKRIVVWDTTIAKLSTPQIAFVAGHEMGHYVLHHVAKGLALGAVGFLIALYLGFRSIGWAISRWGPGWGVRGLDDWACLPALLFLFSVMSFVSNPIAGAVSRYLEHQADQYALEVTHGLTPDSGHVAAQAFQVMGNLGLSDPDPNPAYVFLFYDHPPIRDRVQFCLSYDPWAKGQQPEFVK